MWIQTEIIPDVNCPENKCCLYLELLLIVMSQRLSVTMTISKDNKLEVYAWKIIILIDADLQKKRLSGFQSFSRNAHLTQSASSLKGT